MGFWGFGVQDNSDNKMQKSSNYFGWFVVPGHHLPIGNSFVSGQEPYIGDSHIINLNILKDSPLPRTITYQSLEVPLAGTVCGSSSTELETWMRELLSRVKVESIPFSACDQD